MLVDPPWAGLGFLPQETNGKLSLLLETSQQKYLFERVEAGR